MTRRHLSVFVQVCKEQSMTRAAAALYMTQPAVSQTIGELETYYGAQLFERQAKKLRLTDAGVALLAYAKDILQLFDGAEAHLRAKEFTTLRVGANLSAGTAFLADAVRQFAVEEPMVRVHVHVSGSKKLQRQLVDRALDFALIEDTVLEQGLVATPFYLDRLVVVVSPQSPYATAEELSFADIADADFLLRESGAGVRDALDHWLHLQHTRIEPLWESADTAVLVKAVIAGFGISVLPYLLVQGPLERGEIQELHIRDLPVKRNLNIVQYRSKVLSPAAKRFLAVLQQSVNQVEANTKT